MDASAQATDSNGVLHWQGRIVTAEDLRLRLNGQKEIVLAERTIVTPLAAEHLTERGIRIVRKTERRHEADGAAKSSWAFAQQRPLPLVDAAVGALRRDGVSLQELPSEQTAPTCGWAARLAKRVADAELAGLIVFCDDPEVVCCVGNRFNGIRGAAIYSIAHAARAAQSLGANFVGIEMPGRTLFELRQMLKALCVPHTACPEPMATTLKELESNAHR